MTPRRSARIILLSPQDEVLLIRFVVQRSTGELEFWATPGGQVEQTETDQAAAERELREELGLVLKLEGPVHLATSEFEHEGRIVSNTDSFFVARCSRGDPRLNPPTEIERAAMRECRWWRIDEIARSNARFFPHDIDAVVQRSLQGN